MTDENKQVETGTQGGMETDYLAAIKELKENSVPRQDYDQLKADNKKLLDAVINGQPAEEKPVVKEVDLNQLRASAFKEGQTNLEYCQNNLALRKALIEKGERDPFLPCGTKTLPEQSDIEAAERVASIMQECIDYAQGDSQIFTNELMRRTIDVGPIRRK